MLGIGMPQGFEWVFILVTFTIPIVLVGGLLILVVRKRRQPRGFDVEPRRRAQ